MVIGGWATIAHGLPRTTLDVDLFVRPALDNIERLVKAMSEIGFGIARELDPAEILKKHVFMFADQIRVDVFTRPWGLNDFDSCWKRRFEVEFGSIRIPFVGLEELIRSKETDRPQDRADVESLKKLGHRDEGPGRAN